MASDVSAASATLVSRLVLAGRLPAEWSALTNAIIVDNRLARRIVKALAKTLPLG